MRNRLLFALPVLLLGVVAVLFASMASPGRDAQNTALVRALADPPKLASAETRQFINETRKVERRGFVRRKGDTITAKGWVSVRSPSHGRDGKDGGDYRYMLHTRDKVVELRVGRKPGGLVRISGKNETLAFQPGQVVEVTGRPVSGGVAVERVALAGPPIKSPVLGPVATARPGGAIRKVAVVLFYSPGQEAELPNEASLMQRLVTAPDSVQKYFLQLSSNQLAYSFKVFPAIAAPTPSGCWQFADYDTLSQQIHPAINAAAQASGDSLDNYDHIMNIGAHEPSCGWFAGGETMLRNSFYRNVGPSGPGVREVAHELGHNLGLGHANAAIATNRGAPVAISKTWRNVEYGDGGDLMGFGFGLPGSVAGFNAPQLARLGLLPRDRTLDVTAQDPSTAQPITLGSVNAGLTSGTAPKLLRIRRASIKDPRAADAYLYVDLRSQVTEPGRFVDQFKPNDPILFGVGVRFGSSFGAGSEGFRVLNSSPGRLGTNATAGDYPFGSDLGNQRNMIEDPTLRTTAAHHQDFAVAVGQSMYDPQENLTITTETLGSGQATVRVTTGPPPGNPTNVSVSSGVLTVQAGAGRRNNVVLSEHEGQLIVTDVGNRVVAGAGCTLLADPQTASCSKPAVRRASVKLDAVGEGPFSDLGAVYGSLTLPVTWDGGNGQDSLEGGPGDDTFASGPGGSSGADADLITGGGGNDRVLYSGRTATQPVTVRHDNAAFDDGGASEGDHVADDVTGFVGGSGNDVVKLDPARAQTVDGKLGTDTITGGTLVDTLVSRDGVGGDAVNCGGGADLVFHDSGDTLDGACPATQPKPRIEITVGPEEGSFTSAANPSFSFLAWSASGISYACKLEAGTTPGGATPGPCTTVVGETGSFTPATSPAQGNHVFTVVGTLNGVTTSASRAFRIDRTAPTLSIISSPPATTDASGSNFEFGFSDSLGTSKAQFECSLDNAATWTSCGASTKYPDLAPGNYRLIVRAVDEAGNVSPTQQRDWTVTYDTILNSAWDFKKDDQYPNGPWQFTNERPAFSFQATGTGATFWCRIDSAAWTQCSSATQPWRPATELNLNLPHTIEIAAGNATAPTDPTPLSFTSGGAFFATDINTKLTSGPAQDSVITSTSAAFGFDAYWMAHWHLNEVSIPTELRKFECRVNATAWFPCSSPFTASGLSQGTNTFSVRAVRDDGQRLEEDWTPAVRRFTVDTVGPTATFQTPSPANNSWIAGPDASFAFTGSEAGSTFECKLDAGSWQTCTSPKAVTGLSASTHTYSVRATDPVGNVGASATRTFDVGLPTATMTSGPAAGSHTNNPTPTFTFTATHTTATFECAIGSSTTPAYAPCSSPWTVPTQPAGSQVFRVRAKLPTGQLDPSFSGRMVTFDYTAPDTTLDSGPAAGSTVTTDDVQFAFSAPGESVPTFQCKLDSGNWEACTSPKTVAGLSNGSRTWSVRTVDRAGNVDPTPQSRTFTVAKPKVLTIGAPAPSTPSAVSLTSETPPTQAIDWVKWNGTTPTALTRKAGVNQISTWAPRMTTQPNSVFTGSTTFSWTNAAGTASGSSTAGVATGVSNGRGYRFTIPATNASTRTLKLYVGLRGASVTNAVRAAFSDGVAQSVNLTSTSDTATARTYTITYRPVNATDTLTIEWYQGGGSAKSTALAILYGAAIY